jgi:hypothetical protein
VAEEVGPERVLTDQTGDRVTDRSAARALQEGLTVTAVRDSSIIELAYQNPDPELATEILEIWCARYWAMHMRIHRAPSRSELIGGQVMEARSALHATEDELKELEDAPAVSPEAIAVLEARRVERAGRLAMLEERHETARITDALLEGSLPSITMVQRPTAAQKVFDPLLWPLILALAAGGPLLGMVLASLVRTRAGSAAAPAA